MSYPINKFNSPPNTTNSSRPKEILSHIPSSDQFKQKILSQNKALAKKNSILMTKVADLEIKISDLIQQNIELRAINAKSEDQKRKWLEDKLNIIENGVSQRFEEMFQMFATIRSNEGLASSSVNVNNVIQNVALENSSDKTVSFHDVKSPVKKNISERRRKSARRQSMYIAPPPSPPQDHFNDEANEEDFERVQIPDDFNTPSVFQDEQNYEEVQESNEPQINDAFIAEEDAETEEPELKEHDEAEHAVTLSPIKFSSPKMPEYHYPKFSVYTETEDDNEAPNKEEIDLKIQKLAAGSVKSGQTSEKEKQENEEAKDELEMIDFTDFNEKTKNLLFQDNDKIKHTKSKKQKQKSSKDETMPEPISSDMLSTRKSRTRGKAVNYAEPSLRKKMRRESEQLTDAVIDKDFVVKTESISQPQTMKKDSIDQDLLKASRDSPIKINVQQQSSPIKPVEIAKDPSPVKEQTKPKPTPLIEQDNQNITKRRKPLSTLSQNKVQKKDSKPFKKMQLDIDAAELSVFDLVDECEVGVPKTLKNAPEVSIKKSSRKSTGSRRNSMLL